MEQQRDAAEAEQGAQYDQGDTEEIPSQEEPSREGSNDTDALIIMSSLSSSLCIFILVVMLIRKDR
jgi:hypothetical protein